MGVEKLFSLLQYARTISIFLVQRFLERTIDGKIFLDMFQQWLMSPVQEDNGNEFILQLDGAPLQHSSADDLQSHH